MESMGVVVRKYIDFLILLMKLSLLLLYLLFLQHPNFFCPFFLFFVLVYTRMKSIFFKWTKSRDAAVKKNRYKRSRDK